MMTNKFRKLFESIDGFLSDVDLKNNMGGSLPDKTNR